ncbi:MAG: restriction endonuclease subunit S [Gallionella sp.]|nr:restriction endonuclease subunit S [Gallionella sp.]
MIFNADNFPELPHGWTSLTVDNSVESAGNSNKKLKTKDALEHGRFPVIDQGQSDISGYSDDESLVVEASESSPVILFGDHTRLLKQISQPFVPGADGTKLFRAKSFWDTRFVYQMLRALKLPDKGYARHFQYLRDSVLPLPPLPEQKRVADKLDAVLARVDACRDRLDRIPAILKRFRQSVLAAATSGKLTEDWRVKDLRSLDGWSESTVGELIERIEAGLNVKCEERPPEVGEIGLVKISAVTWGAFNDDESKTLPRGTTLPESARIQVGDFLISRANTLELVGACVIVDKINRPVYLSDKVLRLVLPKETRRWLLYVLRSNAGRKQIETLASGNQLSMRNLSQANLKSIRISMPPADEMCEIIRRVESLFAFAERLEARHAAARAQVEKLTPATLAKAFRGELVPQDPNDEAASELLERIRVTTLSKNR